MTISREDARLFFELFLPLLDFTNKRFNVIQCDETFKDRFEKSKGIDVKNALSVANTLWTNDHLIDEYLEQENLNDECRELVRCWKNHITGKFILERHLKKGSVFISTDNRNVYLVNGLFSSWEEMLQHRKPPILHTATLLPWKNVIISDGLVSITNINFGKNYSSDFKEIYLNAKRNGNIIKSLQT